VDTFLFIEKPLGRCVFLNTIQIKCFLTVAETLSFTKAANILFISQPGLSKQIRSSERELNILLFIRDNQKIRLTPAGAYLLQELSVMQNKFEDIISHAQSIGQGYSGKLCIGTLGGQWIGETFTDYLINFIDDNSSVSVSLKQGSFGELRKWLDSGEIDIALTLPLDVDNVDDLLWEEFEHDTAVFVVSKKLPLGQKEKITLEDLRYETFIAVSKEDSPGAYAISQSFFNLIDFQGRVITASNMQTSMLFVEAGLGFGTINHKSSIVNNPSIRVIEEIPLPGDTSSSCFAWKKSNVNPAIALFLNHK